MQTPGIDETKLSETMRIIEEAAELMAQKDCEEDTEAKKTLNKLQQELRLITGKKKLNIKDFQRYWSAVSLETVAKEALMAEPVKEDVTDAQIKEIVVNILNHNEAEMSWWLKYLKVNTGLENITDYIFYPDFVGLDADASLEDVADKVIEDKKGDSKVKEGEKHHMAEEKLSEVMEIIEKAAGIMEENDFNTNKKVKKELSELQKRLRTLTGKKQFDIKQVYAYWSHSDLETVATQLLMKEPQKCGLSDEALEKLILSIFASGDLEKEASFDYWYDFLELETGIEGVMDYLFCTGDKGNMVYESIDTIMERIRQNREA